MKHNKITSAKKGLSLALFCYFPKKPTTRKKDFNRSHFITLRMDIYV